METTKHTPFPWSQAWFKDRIGFSHHKTLETLIISKEHLGTAGVHKPSPQNNIDWDIRENSKLEIWNSKDANGD